MPKRGIDSIETNIDIVKAAIGMNGRFVDCAIQNNAKGIVVEAFGRENVPSGVFEAIEKAIHCGIPVLVTTRCEQGSVKPIYGNGGGKDLLRCCTLHVEGIFNFFKNIFFTSSHFQQYREQNTRFNRRHVSRKNSANAHMAKEQKAIPVH